MPPEETTKAKLDTQTIMIGRDLASIIRTIADRRGLTMIETLEQYARPALVREYRKCLEEMNAELGGGD